MFNSGHRGEVGSAPWTIVPMWSWCLKTETTNITIGYDGLLRINTCSGILSGHDIFLSAYWLGWAGLGWAGGMQILQSSFNNHGNFNAVF